jgi:DNA polymerase
MAGNEPADGTDPQKALRAVVQTLESLERAGVTHIRKPPPRQRRATADTPRPAREPENPVPAPPEGEDHAAALARIACQVAVCVRCPELARTRKQTVFGVGNPHARLVFMGEAPGADEDRQGEPFVGRAGQKLNEIITRGMGLRREDVYILNTIKCRPPDNRVPAPIEAANCREYLDAQLAVLRPEFICCLGATAAQNLLGVTAAIGQLRGRFHDYRGIPVLCTYHPAYVLRSPEHARPLVWADIQMLMKAMKLPLPNRPG